MITVLGIGPGDPQLMISGYQEYINNADLIVGSTRQLALFDLRGKQTLKLPKLSQLSELLAEKMDREIVILASGDPVLYGIGNWAIKEFSMANVRITPGISSIQYMFNRIGLAMNDSYLTSSHGRLPDFDFVLAHSTVGMVTDKQLGPYQIAQEIQKRGQHRKIWVGQKLSYPDELISEFTEQTVPDQEYEMNVVIITNAWWIIFKN